MAGEDKTYVMSPILFKDSFMLVIGYSSALRWVRLGDLYKRLKKYNKFHHLNIISHVYTNNIENYKVKWKIKYIFQ